MSTAHARGLGVFAAMMIGCAGAAFGQWTSDPSTNNAVTVAPADLCKAAPTSDGGCWVAWFVSVPSPINYNVRIQRFSAQGVPQLGADGILVSANPSQTSTAGEWDLRTDTADNALLSFNDIRGGSDREISVYRISPAGTMLWGPDGVQITNDTVDEFDSRICQTADGLFTVVYSRSNSGTTPPRGLVMQRLDSAGNKLLAGDGVLIAGSGVGGAGASDGPGFFQMIPSDADNVIVSYLRDTRTFTSPRHPTIQKYNASGTGQWNSGNAIVIFASPTPIAYYMNLVSDGAGGALVSWNDNRGGGGSFDSWVQRFNSSGVAQFPAGGAAVSTTAGRLRIAPTAPVLAPSGEVYVFWSERDGSQGIRAMYAQKFDTSGARQWTDAGVALTPFDTEVEDFMRSAPVPGASGGAICVFKSTPTGSTSESVQAIRIDSSGAPVWPTSPLIVSNVSSTKGRFPLAVLTSGSLVSVWSDTRAGAAGIYAQRINVDGTLGNPAAPPCPADFNGQNGITVQDIFDFLSAWFANDARADFNGQNGITVQDIFDFLAAWFQGC